MNEKTLARLAVARENMSEENDVLEAGPVKTRVMICSTQRSGSTLLGDMLAATGVAGVPMEYFNDVNVNAFFERQARQMSLEQYMREIEQYRTTRNGVFGFKAHFWQVTSLLATAGISDPLPFLQRFDYFIIIQRRNKLAQSVSTLRAQQSGQWSSIYKKYMHEQIITHFDPLAITKNMASILKGEKDWIFTLKQLQREPLFVYYEDLLEKPRAQIERILDFCNISDLPQDPLPRLQKQGDSLNQIYEKQYLKLITDAKYTA